MPAKKGSDMQPTPGRNCVVVKPSTTHMCLKCQQHTLGAGAVNPATCTPKCRPQHRKAACHRLSGVASSGHSGCSGHRLQLVLELRQQGILASDAKRL